VGASKQYLLTTFRIYYIQLDFVVSPSVHFDPLNLNWDALKFSISTALSCSTFFISLYFARLSFKLSTIEETLQQPEAAARKGNATEKLRISVKKFKGMILETNTH
jgi:hypothetical protein